MHAADRRVYAHDAVVDLPPGADLSGPGGAVTLALCGAFDHPPPCPLAPHHTRADRRADAVAVRVLFAADPAAEAQVRARIDAALEGGSCTGPDGVETTWTLRSSAAGAVSDEEREHGERLRRS
jgi:hypothetical protein